MMRPMSVAIWGGVLVPYDLHDDAKHKPRATTGFNATHFLTLPVGAPDSVEDAMNHSCDPNTWMADERTVVARRPITAGSEVTTDFALWWAEDYLYTDNCGCGTPLCRRVVTGLDWKRPELQERYKDRFQPFINDKIDQLVKDRSPEFP